MSRVLYQVSRAGLGRLHIEASIVPAQTVTVLTMRETYGPARDFPLGISNVSVGGPQARAATQPGKVMVVSSAPFTLSYDCTLPEYVNSVSLLRGFHRGDALFGSGMAMFYRTHDQRSEYEVSVDAGHVSGPAGAPVDHCVAACPASSFESVSCPAIVAVPPASRRTGERAAADRSACFHFRRAADLQRAYFALGPVIVRRVGRTAFVHEPDFPFVVDDLMDLWPRLLRHAGRILGNDRPTDWTVFLFASDEHVPGRPGVGFSIPGGALVSVSAADDALTCSHTLWLLLHEWAHQWLGEAVGRADPADDWFFEGFTYFAAYETLVQAGLLSVPSRTCLLSLSRRAVAEAKSAGESALAHQGFLSAHRWNALLSRRGSSLANILAALVASHRGETLGGERLLAALAQATPGNRLPDFLRSVAAGVGASGSSG